MKKDDEALKKFLGQSGFVAAPDILSCLSWEKVPCEYTVFTKDEEINYVYMIISGGFVVEEVTYSGEVFLFEELVPGNLIGELEVLMNSRRSRFTVRAQTRAELVKIPRHIFDIWIQRDIRFSNYIMRSLAEKMMSSADKISSFPLYSALEKVARFLLRYCDAEARAGKSFPIIVEVTRSAMGNKMGITERTVNRNIKKLQEKNLISVRRKKINVDSEQYEMLREFMADS